MILSLTHPFCFLSKVLGESQKKICQENILGHTHIYYLYIYLNICI